MRKIKFRGLGIQTARWHFGYIFKGNNDDYYIIDLEKDHLGLRRTIGVIPETIGQYTGLKDADGREIYEDDIIDKYGDIEIVLFHSGMFGSCSPGFPDKSPSDWGGFFEKEICIIGNIHDNPELLKR